MTSLLARDRRPQAAIAAIFLIHGTAFAGWVPRIPEIQRSLGLGEAELGLALLGMPAGSLVAMPVTGWLISRLGTLRMTFACTMIFLAAMTLPPLAEGTLQLAACLFVVGVGVGSMDVSMNAEAAGIEARYDRPIMGLCHGCYSLGGMVGATIGGTVAAVGVAPAAHLAAASLMLLPCALAALACLPRGPRAVYEGAPFALPTAAMAALGLMCLCVLMGEGAIADWSAVYLSGTLEAGAFLAGAGFAAFSLTMTIGRLLGDRIVARLGPLLVVRGGALLAAAGLAAGLAFGHPLGAVAGFAAVGLGLAGIVPILFRAAARVPGVQPGAGIAAVATSGYTGFLAGPPIIGLAAEVVGLAAALGIVCVMLLAVAVMARPAVLQRGISGG
jgi:MFS family permease